MNDFHGAFKVGKATIATDLKVYSKAKILACLHKAQFKMAKIHMMCTQTFANYNAQFCHILLFAYVQYASNLHTYCIITGWKSVRTKPINGHPFPSQRINPSNSFVEQNVK